MRARNRLSLRECLRECLWEWLWPECWQSHVVSRSVTDSFSAIHLCGVLGHSVRTKDAGFAPPGAALNSSPGDGAPGPAAGCRGAAQPQTEAMATATATLSVGLMLIVPPLASPVHGPISAAMVSLAALRLSVYNSLASTIFRRRAFGSAGGGQWLVIDRWKNNGG